MNQPPNLSLVSAPRAVPLGQPFAPVVDAAAGAAERLNELRDMLAAFCLIEAQKYYELAKNTPANVANLRELARVASVVLALPAAPNAAAGSEAPINWSILSDDEAEQFRSLRDKALRAGGRAA